MRQTVIKMHQPAMQITKDYEFILDFGLCPVKKLCKTCPAQCHEHVWQTWNSVVSSHFRTVIKWTKISFPLWHRASRAAQTRANRMLPSQEGCKTGAKCEMKKNGTWLKSGSISILNWRVAIHCNEKWPPFIEILQNDFEMFWFCSNRCKQQNKTVSPCLWTLQSSWHLLTAFQPRALSSNKTGLGFKMAAFEASGSFANLFN